MKQRYANFRPDTPWAYTWKDGYIPDYVSKSYGWGNGTKPWTHPPQATYNNELFESSVLETSQGNPFRKLGKTRERIGGDFSLYHYRVVEDNPTPVFYSHDGNHLPPGGYASNRYHGRLYASVAKMEAQPATGPRPIQKLYYRNVVRSSKSELLALGTTAIARVEPTNPLAGLSVTIGELRGQGLPSVPGIQALRGKTELARSAGSEYLNKEFGWDPLIKDVRKLVHVRNNQQKLIDEYERNSGRKIHRRYDFPEERTEVIETGTGSTLLTPALGANYFVTPPKWQMRTITTKKRWFEGCFTYYLPPLKVEGGNFERNRRLAHKLYGASVTPETIWDLSPWTWAIDWVSNTGDVLHNIGAFADNGLVMLYGYIMEEVTIRRESETWDIRTKSSEDQNNPIVPAYMPPRMRCSSILETVSRQRYTATPYGFGLSFDGFSSFQLSILAALGISRRG